MGSLVLVRHGQASFMAADYDRLSPTGEEQSRRLGERWVERGVRFDAVYVGNRARQIRTGEIVGEVYRAAGKPWPDPVQLDALDEMQAQLLLQKSIPDLVAANPVVRAMFEELHAAPSPEESKKRFQTMFERVMSMWVAGELVAPGVETWREFCARVRGAISMVCGGAGPEPGQRRGGGRRVAAFTSGGPVAAAMQLALDTTDQSTIRIAFAVRNASVSQFLYSGGRFSLDVFNEVSHFNDEARLLTYR